MQDKASILGTYSSVSHAKLGNGVTKRDSSGALLWFALGLASGPRLVQPLNDQGLPSGLIRSVSSETFLREYSPEPLAFRNGLLPVLLSLRGRFCSDSGRPRLETLGLGEACVLRALDLTGHLKTPGIDALSHARALLQDLPDDPHDCVVLACSRINDEAIALRRQKRYDLCIDRLTRALELVPDDAHLLFNLARACYEKGDAEACRLRLRQALQLDPGLRQALRFLDFLDSRPQ